MVGVLAHPTRFERVTFNRLLISPVFDEEGVLKRQVGRPPLHAVSDKSSS
jgi:hypothetical protein